MWSPPGIPGGPKDIRRKEWNMDYQQTESGEYFAAVAESYDRLQPILSPPYSKGLEMMVDLIPFDPNDTFKFVELGCGTAEPTARVLERFPNATGTCMDSEPDTILLAFTPDAVRGG